VQYLQLGPFSGLRLLNEGEDRLREDRSLAVKALTGDPLVAVLE
jgi:hypothetical protein